MLLFFVNHYPQLTNGCVCLWSFFGSRHGKGPHDGASAIVKRFKQAQLDVQGPQLQNANQVVIFMYEHLSQCP